MRDRRLTLSADKLHPALTGADLEVMNFLNQVAMRYPQAISFAPGRPPESLFGLSSALPHIGRFVGDAAFARLHKAEQHGMDALGQYGRTNGIIGEVLARLLACDEGILVDAEDIVVTVGAQEGMCLCLSTLCGNPGDVVLTVDPAYIGLSGAAKLLGIEIKGVPSTDTGIDMDALGDIVRTVKRSGKRPRLLYLSADHANPTGLTLSLEQRQHLLRAAEEHDLLLLEDGAYNYFSYDHEPLPPLKSLPGGERVVFIGSFAKSMFPGLRVGYIAADQRVSSAGGKSSTLAEEISKAKSLLTVNTSPLMQALVGGILLAQDCSLREFVRPRVKAIKASRDSMLSALQACVSADGGLAEQITWNRPGGGFFLTLTMPALVSDEDLLGCAAHFGVTWTPMSYFRLDGAASRQIRLSFSYVTPAEAEVGICRLASWMRSFCAKHQHH